MHACPDCGLSCDCDGGEDSVAECWHCDGEDDSELVPYDDDDEWHDLEVDEDTGNPWDDDD